MTELRRGYKRLSLELHPDKNRSPEAAALYQQVKAAYEVVRIESCVRYVCLRGSNVFVSSGVEQPGGAQCVRSFRHRRHQGERRPGRLFDSTDFENCSIGSSAWGGRREIHYSALVDKICVLAVLHVHDDHVRLYRRRRGDLCGHSVGYLLCSM